jgi:hypothetical protein
MPTPALITLKGRIVQHNTKSETKDGVDILKVGIEAENTIGGENVKTTVTFAVRAGEDAADRFPLDGAVEIQIKPSTK